MKVQWEIGNWRVTVTTCRKSTRFRHGLRFFPFDVSRSFLSLQKAKIMLKYRSYWFELLFRKSRLPGEKTSFCRRKVKDQLLKEKAGLKFEESDLASKRYLFDQWKMMCWSCLCLTLPIATDILLDTNFLLVDPLFNIANGNNIHRDLLYCIYTFAFTVLEGEKKQHKFLRSPVGIHFFFLLENVK